MVGLSAGVRVEGIDHNYKTTQVKMIKGMKFFGINVRMIFQTKSVVLDNIIQYIQYIEFKFSWIL